MARDPRSVMVFAAPGDPRRREQLDALAFDAAAAQRRDVLVVDVAARLDALALCDLYRGAPGAVPLAGSRRSSSRGCSSAATAPSRTGSTSRWPPTSSGR